MQFWRPQILQCPFQTLPSIHKRGETFCDASAESTPVSFGGRLLLVSSERAGLQGDAVRVFDLRTGEVLAQHPWPFGFGCALAVDDAIHVFGSAPSSERGNGIYRTTLNASLEISETLEVFPGDPGLRIFNTSVCQVPDGFVLVYEFDGLETIPFSGRFLRSPDLRSWAPVGDTIHPDRYSACPTIRYLDGWYYVFHLRRHDAFFVTELARSADLTTFHSPGNPVVLAPDAGEGINASDMDLVDLGGAVLLTYAIGDQKTWGGMKTALYAGSFGGLVEEIWNRE